MSEEPTCPRHPSVVSYVRCQRCGRPTCPECQRAAAVGIHCVDCVTAAKSDARPVRSSVGLPVSDRPPLVTYALIVACVAVFMVGPLAWGESWTYTLGLQPKAWQEEPWTVVSSGFAHAGALHLLVNMVVLFQFGRVVEALMGRWRFLVVYGMSLLGGSAVVIALGEPFRHHVGASGAIFGILATYVVLSLVLRRPAYDLMVLAGLWIAAGFFIEWLSWEGHLGGAIAGALAAAAFLRFPQRRASARRGK